MSKLKITVEVTGEHQTRVGTMYDMIPESMEDIVNMMREELEADEKLIREAKEDE